MTTPIHVIDFEGSHQSGIVEYGIVTLEGSSFKAGYTRICAPLGTISERDRAQHGIGEAQACAREPFSADWALFSGLRETGPFAAHNVAVEAGLIRGVWAFPKRCPNFATPGIMGADWGPWVDTLQLYRRIYPGLEGYGLKSLVETFRLQERLDGQARLLCPEHRRRYHCALYDAIASALLLVHLFSESEFKGISLRWLITQSAASAAEQESLGQQELF